jgi:nucleoside-diphosphate-sugar epimerase
MKVLVTGGTGFLGQHLVKNLLIADHDVSIAGRDFMQVDALCKNGARPIVADLRDEAAIRQACKGIEVVFHVGALSAAWGKKSDFHAINVGGTKAIIAGCQEHGVRQLIYVSSPSVVFTGKDIRNATDDLPYPQHFTSVYALTKKLGEDLVNTASHRMATVILRPKAIFGPGDRTLLPQLIAVARRRRLPQIGSGENLVDLTYVENVVQALMLTMDAPAAIGHTYTITNDEHVPLWDTIRQVLRALDLDTDLRKVPLPVVQIAATFMEAQAAITGNEPLLTRYSAAILGCTQTYDIKAAKRDLQYIPRVSVAEGIRRTLATLQETSKAEK